MNDQQQAGSGLWHATTIVMVRKGGKAVIGGDGQVSLGQTIIKGNAKKVRRLAKGEVVAKYFSDVSGQGTLTAFEYLYAGNTLIGTDEFYAGASQGNEETDYDGLNRLTRAAFSEVTGRPYSAYEYDYVGGVFSSSAFSYTTVPSGATYSSYEVDYDKANAFAGEKFFFTNVAGQSYTGEEEDFDAHSKLSRVLLTGRTSGLGPGDGATATQQRAGGLIRLIVMLMPSCLRFVLRDRGIRRRDDTDCATRAAAGRQSA